MQASWRAGVRRVRLFCAEELRPAACCIVDALHTRGYEVSLITGSEARAMLQQPASADLLRVVWAPGSPDSRSRARLREALDPDAAGDVLVLAAPTPRGVIEAIDAFGAPARRRRVAHPRRGYLAQPTLMELERGARSWWVGGSAVAGLVLGVIAVVGLSRGPAAVPAPASPPAAAVASQPRLGDGPVLASTRAALAPADDVVVDATDDDDDEPVILEAARAPRGSAAPIDAGSIDASSIDAGSVDAAPIEPAPLEHTRAPARSAAAVTLPTTTMPGAAPRGIAAGAIDPF